MNTIGIQNPKLIVTNDYQQFLAHFEWFLALFQISDVKPELSPVELKVSKNGIFWATVPEVKTRRSTLKRQNSPLMGSKTKMDDSIWFPVKSRFLVKNMSFGPILVGKSSLENSIISFVTVFPISIFQLLPIITPLLMDQLT